jgi:(2Fe-2S) ferredoxin
MPEFVLLLRDSATSYANMGPEQMQAIVQRYVASREGPAGRSHHFRPQAAR